MVPCILKITVGLILCLAGMNCTNSEEMTESHYLPDGFTGQVTITFAIPTAQRCEASEGGFKYNIGPDGNLVCSEPMRYVFRNADNFRVFYVDDQGAVVSSIPFERNAQGPDDICLRGPYPVNNQMHYFIDRKDKLDSYVNPAIDEESRQ